MNRLIVAAAASVVTSLCVAAPAVNASKYPALTTEQLGHINYIVNVAKRLDGDWSEMGHSEPGQGGFDAYRYQLAMMSYTLNLANYHYTPAYRDIYQQATAGLIDKMMRFDVWGFWELTSKGSIAFNPQLKQLGEGWIDPIKDQNIMYSGHLFQMINTYAMLYNEPKFDKPASISFEYDPVGRGMGPQKFQYDIHSFAKVLYDQFVENGWRGIECEPNAIFPECNQHPILGYAAYDKRHGSDYFKRVSSEFKRQFDAMKYIDPRTNSFMGMYLVQQDKVLYNALPWSDGWSGAFMHGWSKADVEQIYPIQRENYLAKLPDGTATVKIDKPRGSYSHDHGFFAVLAAEVGDSQTQSSLIAYADKYWRPQWQDGGLNYPRHDEFTDESDKPGANVWRRVQVLTGNGLMGLARVNIKDGFYRLYNQPWGADHFDEPFISGVQYPQTLVSRAVYDRASQALIVTVRPAIDASQPASTSWRIGNLDPKSRYSVWRDGERVGAINRRVPSVQSQKAVELSVQGEFIAITHALGESTTFVVQKE